MTHDIHDYDRRLAATAEALTRQFGDRAAVKPGEALAAIGGSSIADPERAALQRMQRHSYPFRLTRIGRRQVVLICDIAATLVGPPPVSPPPGATPMPYPAAPSAKRGPGRPRKIRPISSASAIGGAP